MPYPHLELVSHHLCPYVQRAVITLSEKSIKHQRTYIDLSNKPEWFLKLSPTGKVPLLKVDHHTVLFESSVICEFLDEITPPTLHPLNAITKAQHRAWNELASNILGDISALYNAPNQDSFKSASDKLAEKFSHIEHVIVSPYFSGTQFSMVDAAFGPVFRYFDTIDPYLANDIFLDNENLIQWREKLSQRASVQDAVSSDYPQQLQSFLLNRKSYLSQLMAQSLSH